MSWEWIIITVKATLCPGIMKIDIIVRVDEELPTLSLDLDEAIGSFWPEHGNFVTLLENNRLTLHGEGKTMSKLLRKSILKCRYFYHIYTGSIRLNCTIEFLSCSGPSLNFALIRFLDLILILVPSTWFPVHER